MAFCPICYPDIIEDGDGDRYLPGPMITDEETGELVEDEGERTHIPDEGDVCDRHNVYVSGHRDEGGVWGHPLRSADCHSERPRKGEGSSACAL